MAPNLKHAIEHFGHYDKLCAKSVLNRVGQPDEIAAGVPFLTSEDASFVTASNLVADGGYLSRRVKAERIPFRNALVPSRRRKIWERTFQRGSAQLSCEKSKNSRRCKMHSWAQDGRWKIVMVR